MCILELIKLLKPDLGYGVILRNLNSNSFMNNILALVYNENYYLYVLQNSIAIFSDVYIYIYTTQS